MTRSIATLPSRPPVRALVPAPGLARGRERAAAVAEGAAAQDEGPELGRGPATDRATARVMATDLVCRREEPNPWAQGRRRHRRRRRPTRRPPGSAGSGSRGEGEMRPSLKCKGHVLEPPDIEGRPPDACNKAPGRVSAGRVPARPKPVSLLQVDALGPALDRRSGTFPLTCGCRPGGRPARRAGAGCLPRRKSRV